MENEATLNLTVHLNQENLHRTKNSSSFSNTEIPPAYNLIVMYGSECVQNLVAADRREPTRNRAS